MGLLPLGAQDISDDFDSPATESTTDSTTVESKEDEAPIRDLERETLPQDIESLNFFQLVNWLEQLELSTQGDVGQLRQRLYEHYQIDPAERAVDSPSTDGGRRAIIESALIGDYFGISESDEKYVRLQGGVLVEFIDSTENVTHTIEAQELILNQDERFFTARGEVHYTITRESGSEEFFGNTLTFQTDDWDGYLVQGRGVTQQSGEDNTTFRYQAKFISRSTDDVVVMEDVIITSSPALDPYYRIEASKVWILGEGEWGLQDATLYVGEIPLLYFPYFFRPGDEILFHPVFGAREREGFFIQTTTYFIGRKPPAQDRLSFLQRSSSEGRRQIVDGIFLRDSPEAVAENPLNSDWYLKLLIDYYSRLGVYVGLDGLFNNLEPFERFRFETAIAASRHIFPNGAGNFTTLYGENNQAIERWVVTSTLGITLPIRYFMDVNLSLALDSFRSELIFEIYSDRFITQDYGDRAEENDWFSIISGAEPFLTTTTTSTTNSFQWRSASSLTFAQPLDPFISQIQFSDITLSLNWLSRNADSNLLPAHVLAAQNSPQRAFFYPSNAVTPNIRFGISGTLLNPAIASGSTLSVAEGTTDTADSIEVALRPPWEAEGQEPSQEAEDEADSPYREIEILDSGEDWRPRQPLDYAINYNLDSSNNIQLNTDNQVWRQASDVNFDLLYSTYTSDNQLRLGYVMNLYENYLRFEGSAVFNGRYRTLLADQELSDTERTRLRNQSYDYNLFDINNNMMLSSFFLQEIDPLRTSSLAYSINTEILRYDLESIDAAGAPQYQTRLLGWDPETITAHLTRLNIVWNILGANQSLQTEYRLPPLDQRVSSTLGLQFGPLSLGATFLATERADSDIWNVEPFTARAALAFLDNELSLSSQLTANLEESYIDSLNVTFRAWFFNAQFNMQYVDDIQFNPNFRNSQLSSPWLDQGPRQLRPTNVQASINESFEIDPFWKNRIRFSFAFNSTLLIDLQRFTQSNFRLGFNFSFFIHEFLEITLSSSILNDQIYLYIPELAATTGRTPRNFFLDLLRSINIFDMADLQRGLFKLQDISLRVVHHLVDWDLEFELSASPTLESRSGALPRYVWDPVIGILVTWRPIPELRKDIDIDRQGTLVVE